MILKVMVFSPLEISGKISACENTVASMISPAATREKFAAIVERNWSGIAAYCEAEQKFSLGFVEGVNTK